MRIVGFDDVSNLPPGRLFAIWDGGLNRVYVKGPDGPQGQLMVRSFFELSREGRQALDDGRTAVLEDKGLRWLQGYSEARFVIFERRDLDKLMPQVSTAAQGIEIAYQGGSLDGVVEWVDELPTTISSDDQTTTPAATSQDYIDTGTLTPEGYRIFRVRERRNRD